MTRLRLLTATDADLFKSLRLLAIDNSPTSIWPTHEEESSRSTEQMAARIQATAFQAVFGAFVDNALIGVTGVRREPFAKVIHKATIWGVFVDPVYRKQGIAQSLLSAVSAHASNEWQCIQLMLCVNAENVAAKKLYTSMGFERFGIEPRAMCVQGKFYDEEYMVKRLS